MDQFRHKRGTKERSFHYLILVCETEGALITIAVASDFNTFMSHLFVQTFEARLAEHFIAVSKPEQSNFATHVLSTKHLITNCSFQPLS